MFEAEKSINTGRYMDALGYRVKNRFSAGPRDQASGQVKLISRAYRDHESTARTP
jgi:hypothetical protein